MLASKKERAFYTQTILVVAYVILRFFNGSLATFDMHFTTLMTLLASYHIIVGVQDSISQWKGGQGAKKE
jgi:hypothetical protein